MVELGFHPDYTVPLGEFLRELLNEYSLTPNGVASMISESEAMVEGLLSGTAPFTSEILLSLETSLGPPPDSGWAISTLLSTQR